MRRPGRRTLGPSREVAAAFRWLLTPRDDHATEASHWLELAERSSGSAVVVKCGPVLAQWCSPAASLVAWLSSSPARAAERDGAEATAKHFKALGLARRYFASLPAFEDSATLRGLDAAIRELRALGWPLLRPRAARRGRPSTRHQEIVRRLCAAGLRREHARELARLAARRARAAR